jgi:hypothetical protein
MGMLDCIIVYHINQPPQLKIKYLKQKIKYSIEVKCLSAQKCITKIWVGLKTGRRKTGRANLDTFLDITLLLLELLLKFKLICKVETNN